jgi:hypothetical protein
MAVKDRIFDPYTDRFPSGVKATAVAFAPLVLAAVVIVMTTGAPHRTRDALIAGVALIVTLSFVVVLLQKTKQNGQLPSDWFRGAAVLLAVIFAITSLDLLLGFILHPHIPMSAAIFQTGPFGFIMDVALAIVLVPMALARCVCGLRAVLLNRNPT